MKVWWQTTALSFCSVGRDFVSKASMEVWCVTDVGRGDVGSGWASASLSLIPLALWSPELSPGNLIFESYENDVESQTL